MVDTSLHASSRQSVSTATDVHNVLKEMKLNFKWILEPQKDFSRVFKASLTLLKN